MDNITDNKRIRTEGITIDGPRARDLDDAFWLEEKGDGYILHVSIADVGYNIKADSFIDIEARKRCFTRYLKHANLPMFPHKYSEGVLSLLHGKNRPAITISIPIDSLGETKTPTIRKTVLKNKAKLSYEKAALIMESAKHQYNEVLKNSHDLAQLLFRKRRKSGAITIYSLHNRLTTTEEGLVKMISPEDAFNSHILIQEFMILTNQIVAVFFANNNIPGLFRNHTSKAISPDRNLLLSDVNNVINLGDIGRIETLVERFALIFNKAEYSPIIKGHFSLNLPAYMHITSPIRRFADLVNIRQLSAFISNKKLPYSMSELVEIGKHINDVALAYKEEKNEYFRKRL